jgi:hypothetical protein
MREQAELVSVIPSRFDRLKALSKVEGRSRGIPAYVERCSTGFLDYATLRSE